MPSPTTSSPVVPSTLTGNGNVDSLIDGTQWANPSISYSFPWVSGGASFFGPNGNGNYSTLNEANASDHFGLNATQQNAARGALQAWANVAKIQFQEVADTASNVGDIRFAWTSATDTTITGGQAWGWAYLPDSYHPFGGDVWISTLSGGAATDPNWSAGSYNFNALIHELGHVLGLKHPFESSSLNSTIAPSEWDSRVFTLMSYTTIANRPDLIRFTFNPTTPMLLDIAAVQAMYGANYAFNAGDTTYSFNDNLGQRYFQTIWDGGGNNTFSYSGNTSSTIDLRPGYGSTIGNRVYASTSTNSSAYVVKNVWIAYGTQIDKAVCTGYGNNTLQANDDGDVLIGGSGNDMLIGGAGNDTIGAGSGKDRITGGGGRDVFLFAASGSGIDTITDFSAGDSIEVSGERFSGNVSSGSGAGILANQVQLASSAGVTTLYIGTDATPGADVQIILTGTFSANQFLLYQDQLLINSLPTGAVTITGTPTQNQTLTVSNTLADADGLGTIGYQWQAAGVNIAGATASSYTLTQAEVGEAISVVARYTDGHGTAESKTSSSTLAVTSSDTTAPTATTFSPADEAAGVSIGANITLTFSEAIQRGSGNIVLETTTGTTVATFDAATSSNLTVSGSTLTINPTADLAYSTDYKVEFASGTIKDLAGNSYAGTTSYNFTTLANPANQTFTGTSANDSFTSGTGNDTIDGGAGVDSVLYSGTRASYIISKSASGFTVSDTTGHDGTDTLQNVERLKFSDIGIALDVSATQSGGETQLLLGTVLGMDLLSLKKPLIGVVIDLFDQGYTLQVLSGAAMRLPIWDGLTGQAIPTNTQIASYLLTTVNKAAPDAATLAAAVTALDTETGAAQGNFLWHLAESSANQTQVGLVGLATTGLEFGG